MTESPIFVDKQIGERRMLRIHRSLEQEPKELVTERVEQSIKNNQVTEKVIPVPEVDYLAFDSSEAKVVFEAPHQNGKVFASAARELQEALAK